ncbi:MAG: glycosyltransferase [Myxococcales bacterium]|nr:glycosyltransferase [Myxococcales bacterium]
MKLLLINSFLHPRGGDTTLFFSEWAGWEARGVEVIPFAMRHPDNIVSPWAERFPVWRSPRDAATLSERLRAVVRATWNVEATRALARLIRDVRPDAAHAHHLHRHLTPAIFPVLRAAGVRSAWTLHDHELVCPNGLRYTGGQPCFRCQGGHYAAAVLRRCKDDSPSASLAVAAEKAVHRTLRAHLAPDVYIAPSEALLDGLVADGLARARCVHVPNLVGVDATPGEQGANVIFAGRLTVEKGVLILAAAARALPAVRFDVYGDGPARPALLGLPNLRLWGARPRAEVHSALATCGVVVLPSLWPENQPYAVLESQLLGRAVVASAVGGVPEIVTSEVDGILVRPGAVGPLVAAVARLLEDRTLAARLGTTARARVQGNHGAERWYARMRPLLGIGDTLSPCSS